MPLTVNTDPDEIRLRLEAALGAPRHALLLAAAGAAARRRESLFLVGGFVRDLLLGVPGQDLDLVVEGDAPALGRALVKAHGGRLTVHARFGTASWAPQADPGRPLDLITARSERYTRPGALPTVQPGTLSDDLRRRDFSINALAVCLDRDRFGELRDELGGLEDLRSGRVRALHPASYQDDPTRILRAARYAERYGFVLGSQDPAWIQAACPLLGRISGERVRHELDLVLADTRPARTLARLEAFGALGAIHPGLGWDETLEPFFERLRTPEPPAWQGVPDLRAVPRRAALGYLVWLADLDPLEVEPLAARLDFTAGLRQALTAAADLRRDLPGLVQARPSRVAARLDGLPLLSLCALSLRSEPAQAELLERYLGEWRHVRARTTGRTLERLGLAPGPAFRAILAELRALWLDGDIRTAEQEDQRLAALVRDMR